MKPAFCAARGRRIACDRNEEKERFWKNACGYAPTRGATRLHQGRYACPQYCKRTLQVIWYYGGWFCCPGSREPFGSPLRSCVRDSRLCPSFDEASRLKPPEPDPLAGRGRLPWGNLTLAPRPCRLGERGGKFFAHFVSSVAAFRALRKSLFLADGSAWHSFGNAPFSSFRLSRFIPFILD